MARYGGPRRGWQLNVEVEQINITSERDEIDSDWRGTCSNGHDVTTRTMRVVVDRSHWCNGDEGMYRHDPHRAIDAEHYECPTCRVRVEPAIIPAYTPRYMAGMKTGTLVGPSRYAGEKITISLTGEEIATIEPDDDAADAFARRLLWDPPADRVILREFSMR